MNNNIQELLNDDEFLTGLVECTTPEELVEVLKKKNIQLEDGLSPEDAFKIVKEHQNDELNEEDLEVASGGIAITLAVTSALVFIVAGAELSFFAGYAYQKVKKYGKGRRWW